MKICYVCSRYAGDLPERIMNLVEARALALLAESRGYAVVGWWSSLDPRKPMTDEDPEVRARALERRAALAEMVGEAAGAIVLPDWYPRTVGMNRDFGAWYHGQCCLGGEIVKISSDEVVDFIPSWFLGAFRMREHGNPAWKEWIKDVRHTL